jgi:hypothetical protein
MREQEGSVETDPLDAFRVELVAAARRQANRRRMHRRVVTATLPLIVLLALAGGVSALTDFSTGVPPIDDLLDREAPSLVGEPGPGGATEPLAVPTNDGVAQAVAYLSSKGTICQAEAREPRSGGAPVGGAGGCFPAADLADRLNSDGVVWSGLATGPARRVYSGYADGDVTSIRVLGLAAATDVKMTRPWTPGVPDGKALRLFVIVDETDIDVGDDGVQAGEHSKLPMEYPKLEVTRSDGRQVVTPP